MANWYRLQKESGFKQRLKQVARPALLMAPLGLGVGFLGDNSQNPQQEPVPVVQPAFNPIVDKTRIQPASNPVSDKPASAEETKVNPPVKETPVQKQNTPIKPNKSDQPGGIDIKKIIHMESSGRKDAVSPVGAAGLMQVMPATWEDIAKKIGKYHGFEKYKFDETANVAIGSYYINTEVPRLLKAFEIPDTVDTRLAAYNWGIGNVKKVYRNYGEEWKNYLPKETSDYLKKYRR